MASMAADGASLALSFLLVGYVLKPKSGAEVTCSVRELTPTIIINHIFALLLTLLVFAISLLASFPPFFLRFQAIFLAVQLVYIAIFALERSKWTKYYDRIPGPKGSEDGLHWLLGQLPLIRKHSKIWLTDYNITLHEKFGPVVCMPPLPWLKFSQIKVTSPEDVRFILRDRFENFIKPPFFSIVFKEILGDGIFNSNHANVPDGGRSWKLQRKIASNIFTSRQFKTKILDTFLKNGRHVVSILDKHAESGAPLDWQVLCHAHTLESIGDIGFNIQLQCLSELQGKGVASPFAAAFDRAQYLSVTRMQRPGWNSWVGRWGALEREMREVVKVLKSFSSKVISDRRVDPELEKKSDILSLFLNYKPKEGEEAVNFDDKFLSDVVMSFVIAGRDTTASTLTSTMLVLSQNPTVEERLLEEIDDVFPSGVEPTVDALKNNSMPYLDGVIKEVLRLYPPVPMDPKYAVEEVTLPSGYTVPARSLVIYQPYVMGRSADMYTDPLVVDPTRWMHQPEPNQYSFPVFQAGRRICLGMTLAYLEVKVLVVQVLQRYRLHVLRPAPGEKIEYTQSLTLSFEGGLSVRVDARAQSTN